ncbi:MAG: hypothetical protein ABSG16_16970 [Candidatus Acidiferrum sp.]|jgi:hypothetical protein
MQFAKRLLMGAAAVVLVAVLMMLVSPKTARAVVATLIRDADNPGRATQVSADCTATSQSGFATFLNCSPFYTVPAGDRLVIQQVDTNCFTLPGNSVVHPKFIVEPGNASPPVPHNITLVDQGVDAEFVNAISLAGSQSVNYFADPGSTLVFSGYTADTTGSTVCTMQFSGYLISYP